MIWIFVLWWKYIDCFVVNTMWHSKQLLTKVHTVNWKLIDLCSLFVTQVKNHKILKYSEV